MPRRKVRGTVGGTVREENLVAISLNAPYKLNKILFDGDGTVIAKKWRILQIWRILTKISLCMSSYYLLLSRIYRQILDFDKRLARIYFKKWFSGSTNFTEARKHQRCFKP